MIQLLFLNLNRCLVYYYRFMYNSDVTKNMKVMVNGR